MEEILKQILNELKDLRLEITDLRMDTTVLKEGQERIETKVDRLSSELRSNFKYTNDKLEITYPIRHS